MYSEYYSNKAYKFHKFHQLISSHVKNKNRIFTGYKIFVNGKILIFHRCLYNKVIFVIKLNKMIKRGTFFFKTRPDSPTWCCLRFVLVSIY